LFLAVVFWLAIAQLRLAILLLLIFLLAGLGRLIFRLRLLIRLFLLVRLARAAILFVLRFRVLLGLLTGIVLWLRVFFIVRLF